MVFPVVQNSALKVDEPGGIAGGENTHMDMALCVDPTRDPPLGTGAFHATGPQHHWVLRGERIGHAPTASQAAPRSLMASNFRGASRPSTMPNGEDSQAGRAVRL